MLGMRLDDQRLAFDYMDAPVVRVTTADTPLPYAPTLIEEWLPNPQRVIEAVLDTAAAAGVDDVHLIAALALHRRMTEAELREAVGDQAMLWPADDTCDSGYCFT
jgi:hypothetical protein